MIVIVREIGLIKKISFVENKTTWIDVAFARKIRKCVKNKSKESRQK